jgi:hypothetical protein
MKPLNLPETDLRIRTTGNRTEVFDIIRKRYIKLTPEEWVRQHFIHFLIENLKVPASLTSVESTIQYNGLVKRCDIVVFGTSGSPVLIVECKAPEVQITQDVFDQVALYNMTLMVKFLIVTNGLEHYSCLIDHENRSYSFLKEMPGYEEMTGA